jgi:hypothetical protein
VLHETLPALSREMGSKVRLTQTNGKAIAVVNATAQFACIPRDAQYAQAFRLQRFGCGRGLPRHVQTEPLPRDRVAILQATVADQTMPQAQGIGQTGSRSIAIEITLFHPDEAVLAHARWLKAEHFLHNKVIRRGFEAHASQRATVEMGKAVWIKGHFNMRCVQAQRTSSGIGSSHVCPCFARKLAA